MARLAKQNAALALRVGELEEEMRERAAAAGRAAEAARDRIREVGGM